jgi:hypothetical protein
MAIAESSPSVFGSQIRAIGQSSMFIAASAQHDQYISGRLIECPGQAVAVPAHQGRKRYDQSN